MIRNFLLIGLLCGFLSVSIGAERADAEIKLTYFGITQGRLAFTYKKSKRAPADIYLIDFETLEVKPLIASAGLEEYPVWNPKGTKLAYYAEVAGNRDIYVANSDGSHRKRLTTSPAVDEDPFWSPSGSRIVFHSGRLGSGYNLFVMNADGSGQKGLTKSRYKNTVPKWSPRGDFIVYSTSAYWPGWDLSLFDVRARTSAVLTKGYKSYCRASWHPDGSSIAFSHGTANDIDIWLKKIGPSSPEQLTDLPGREYDVEWTSDGSRFFFVSESQKGKGDFQLYLFDMNSKTAKKVAEGPGSMRHPSWTPFVALPPAPPPPPPRVEAPQQPEIIPQTKAKALETTDQTPAVPSE